MGGGEDGVFVAGQEGLEAVPELAVEALGPRNGGAGERKAFFDFAQERVLVELALGLDAFAVVRGREPSAQRFEREVGAGEVRLGFLDDGAQ